MTFLSTILHTASLVGLAEMGDRSQLVCIALAARHRAGPVLVGAMIAFSTMNLVSVTVGALAARALPPELVLSVAGLLMLGFAAWTALDTGYDDPERALGFDEFSSREIARGPVVSSAVALLASELGDKTQLGLASMSSANPAPAVWIGGTAALMLTSCLAVLVGRTLHDLAPPRYIRYAAAGFFALTGVWMLARPWW